MKHTPTPWKLFGDPHNDLHPVIEIQAGEKTAVCHWMGFDSTVFTQKQDLANAEFIVTAVNAFHGYRGDLEKVEEGHVQKLEDKVNRLALSLDESVFGQMLLLLQAAVRGPWSPNHQRDAEALLDRSSQGGA